MFCAWLFCVSLIIVVVLFIIDLNFEIEQQKGMLYDKWVVSITVLYTTASEAITTF